MSIRDQCVVSTAHCNDQIVIIQHFWEVKRSPSPQIDLLEGLPTNDSNHVRTLAVLVLGELGKSALYQSFSSL